MNEKRTLIMIYEETFKHLQKTLLNDNYLYCKFPKKMNFLCVRARVCVVREVCIQKLRTKTSLLIQCVKQLIFLALRYA